MTALVTNMSALLSYIDVTTVLLALLLILVVGYVLSKRERAGIPPGPPFYPIVGNIFDMRGEYLGKRHRYFQKLKKQYGDIFRIYNGPHLLIVLNSFDLVNEVFVKQKENFSARPTSMLWGLKYTTKQGKGIIWSSDQEWKTMRRTTLHSLRDLGFGKSTLTDKIMEESAVLVDLLSDMEGQPFSPHEILMKATTNIICALVFGNRYDYNDPEFHTVLEFVDMAFKGEGPLAPIHVFPYLRHTPMLSAYYKRFSSVHVAITSFIQRRLKEHENTFSKNNIRDFIDSCLSKRASGEVIDNDSMERSVSDLFVAGADTTANTLDWSFLYMMLNPTVQKKCQEELDNVVGSSRMVKLTDRSNLPYIDATLLEVMRLGNTVPISLPHLTLEDSMVDGYVIPKGSIVYANMYECHHDPKYFKNPMQFQPERFLDKEGKLAKPDSSFIPFSAGPRICLGESLAKTELFLFFTNVLQRFNIQKAGTEELQADGHFGISMSTPPYKIKVKRR